MVKWSVIGFDICVDLGFSAANPPRWLCPLSNALFPHMQLQSKANSDKVSYNNISLRVKLISSIQYFVYPINNI